MTDVLDALCLTKAECEALIVIAGEWRLRARDRTAEQARAMKRAQDYTSMVQRAAAEGWAEANGEQAKRYDNYDKFLTALVEKYGPPESNVFSADEMVGVTKLAFGDPS